MPDGRAAVFTAAFALFAVAASGVGPGRPPEGDKASPAGAVPRLERIAPPPEVPATMRAAVGKIGIAMALPSGGISRVWPARRVDAAAPPTPDEPAFQRERVRFPIEQGSLVAIVSLAAPWTDYRGQRISPGTYALVYAIQPSFKQHRGVSEFRDALLLVRPADALVSGDLATLVAASRVVSGTSHPAVAALFPVDRGAQLPRVSPRSDGGLTLEFLAGVFRVGLSVSGKGRLNDEP